jgi:hypothetical protein
MDENPNSPMKRPLRCEAQSSEASCDVGRFARSFPVSTPGSSCGWILSPRQSEELASRPKPTPISCGWALFSHP